MLHKPRHRPQSVEQQVANAAALTRLLGGKDLRKKVIGASDEEKRAFEERLRAGLKGGGTHADA